MNIWQHIENKKEAERLRKLGFDLTVNGDGYFVKFKGVGIGGASVMRTKRLHWRHRDANIRDFLSSAIQKAKASKFYEAVIR